MHLERIMLDNDAAQYRCATGVFGLMAVTAYKRGGPFKMEFGALSGQNSHSGTVYRELY
jgi:hypothetical protein